MATKLRCARMLIYSAAEMKEAHVPYGMESAMAKMYASDIALEVTNDALQIFGGSGFMKGMEVERAYRDAKITTIYEGTNEIQRVVIASHLLGKPPKSESSSSSKPKKPAPVTGVRKNMILRDGTAEEKVSALVEHLKKDGHDFTVGIDIDTPIVQAERVVSAGKGIGDKKNMKLIEKLAKAAGPNKKASLRSQEVRTLLQAAAAFARFSSLALSLSLATALLNSMAESDICE